jgi:integrase
LAMKSDHLKLVESTVMRPVASKGRKPNATYRVREHLTEEEVSKLLAALKANRYGHRDSMIGLLIYRHGLRVSEACDLRWDDLDLPKRTIVIRRLKGSQDSSHYLERDEVAGLKALQRLYAAQGRGSIAWASPVWSKGPGEPLSCRLPYTSTCSGTAPAMRWQTEVWIRADCNITSATPRLRIRCAIPQCRRSRSRIFGDKLHV